ncbi:MAG: hypothetical protein CMI93_01275 [Pelagibacteraceae bacterium]|nr:hypothetical protein [Pelagibacteraceae bacterium]|tara:strand:- start:764 stop:2458 length:1695 start_codon:yes stop_codon:yes gene_type:complete
MNKFFIIIFFFFFYFHKSLLAIDSGNYLAGESAFNNKDNKTAIYYFKNAIDLNKLDTEFGQNITKKLCVLYLLEGEIDKCILIGKKIEKNLTSDSIENTNILMALIVGDIKRKKFNSALNRLKKINKSSFERFSVPIIEAWIIAGEERNLNKAKQKLDELKKDYAVNTYSLRNLNLALIYDFFNKNDKALIYYQKSINDFTKPSYRLVEILSNAYERNGDFEKAKDIYTKFLSNHQDNLLVEKSLKRIEKKAVPNKLIANTNDAIAELFSTISSTFSSDFTNNFAIVYSHFSLYLKKDFEVAQLYLAELLEEKKRYVEANNLYEKIKPSSNFYWHSKLKKARNLELLGDSEKSIPILKEMSNEKQERHDSLKLLGDIYRNYNKYKEAIKFYNEAVSRIQKISSEHWELLYSRGMAYERNNQWIKAEKDFLKILELVPNQPDVLNYLAYSWIEQDSNLEQAKKFILKAASIKPRDPYIVDSLGWAYYNLKEYDKAIKELEKAIDLKPTDPIINDHLGDAYLKVDRKLEALYQWKKAIQFKPENDLEKKIEKKIKKYDKDNQLDLL